MKQLLIRTFLIASSIALGACTTSYHFKVDAISATALGEGQSFVIVSGNEHIRTSDLRFQEAARFVATALEGKGYYRARDIASADVIVEVSYYLGEPRESFHARTYPETHWTRGFSYVVRVPVYSKSGVVVEWRNRVVHEPPRSYTHWQERVDTSVSVEKELRISAYDNRPGAPLDEPRQLWSVIVINTDGSDNLRHYLPYMVAAALPYIGLDTGSQVHVSLPENDPKVEFIKVPDLGIERL